MKIASTLLSWLALAASTRVVEGRLGIFSFLHAHNNDAAEAESEETDPAVEVVEELTPEQTQSLVGGGALSTREIDIGKRGFQCLQLAAGVPSDPFGDSLGILVRPMTRLLLYVYGEDGINALCGSTRRGRVLLQEAGISGYEETSLKNSSDNSSSSSKSSSSQTTRDIQACASSKARSPDDPSMDPGGVYGAYASQYFDEYLYDNDRSRRSNPEVVTQKVYSELNNLVEARNRLNRCMNIWSGFNQVVGLIDPPLIDQDKISESIQSFTCGLARSYNEIVISRNLRTLERLDFHDHVIDGLEIQATYENTFAVMSSLCSTSTLVEAASEDLQIIEKEATPATRI